MEIIDIKKYIYENNLLKEILLEIGMHNIKENNKFFSCSFPDGDNPYGCLIYKNFFFNVVSYTRDIKSQFNTLDLIDLVHFVCKFDNLYNTINKIKEICNLKDDSIDNKKIIDYYGNIKFKNEDIPPYKNNIMPIEILNKYINKPHIDLYKEGISLDAIKEFCIRFDLKSERIIFPHFNKDNKNEILATVGRTTKQNFEEYKSPKYLIIDGKGYKKSENLYGLAQNVQEIKNKKSVIIFEAEKSVLKCWGWNYKNCVSIGSHNISQGQIEILLSLNVTEVVIAFDKDISIPTLLKNANKLKFYFKVFIIFDNNFLLNEKDSPVDKGIDIFNTLFQKKYTISDLYALQKELDDE